MAAVFEMQSLDDVGTIDSDADIQLNNNNNKEDNVNVNVNVNVNNKEKEKEKEKDNDDIVINMENIHKTYLLGLEGVPALRGVNLKIKRGEFVAVYGSSGGGKTTVLNIMGTIDKPTKGMITIDGLVSNVQASDKSLAYMRLSKIGFVFQTFNLLSSMTALENVMIPMTLLGKLSVSEKRSKAIALLRSVGMGDRLEHLPSMLSGGEQQRVTIARALANDPSILLLDEPTGDLDTTNTAIVMELLRDLNRKGLTLVMVTHDSNLKRVANRVIFLSDGKVISDILQERLPDNVTVESILKEQGGDHGDNNASSSSSSTTIIETRTPDDYPYVKFLKQKREMEKKLLELHIK